MGDEGNRKLRERNPGRVPIICQMDSSVSAVACWGMKREKFLVSDKLSIAQFRRFVKSNLVHGQEVESCCAGKPPRVALFIAGEELVDDNMGILELDERHRSADGLLYVKFVTRSSSREHSKRLEHAGSQEVVAEERTVDGLAGAEKILEDGIPRTDSLQILPTPGEVQSTKPEESVVVPATEGQTHQAEESPSGEPSVAPADDKAKSGEVSPTHALSVENSMSGPRKEDQVTPSREQNRRKESTEGVAVRYVEQPATAADVDDIFKAPIYTASPSPIMQGSKPASTSEKAPSLSLEEDDYNPPAPPSRTLTISQRPQPSVWPKPQIYNQQSADQFMYKGFDSMILSDDSSGRDPTSSIGGWPSLSRESTADERDGAFVSHGAPLGSGGGGSRSGFLSERPVSERPSERPGTILAQLQERGHLASTISTGSSDGEIVSPLSPPVSVTSAVKAPNHYTAAKFAARDGDEWVQVDEAQDSIPEVQSNTTPYEKGRAFLMGKISRLEQSDLLPTVSRAVTSKAASLRSIAAKIVRSSSGSPSSPTSSSFAGFGGTKRNEQFSIRQSSEELEDDFEEDWTSVEALPEEPDAAILV